MRKIFCLTLDTGAFLTYYALRITPPNIALIYLRYTREGYRSLPKLFYQELRNGVGTAVVVLRRLVFTLPQATWENCVIAEVSVSGAATVDVDGAALGGGEAHVTGVERRCVEQDRGASGTDEVLRGVEIVSLKWE